MDEPLPSAVEELLDEDDAFRLTVRAHAAIEQYIKMAIQSRFVDQKLPDEFKHLGFTRTLTLAISLGLVPPEIKRLSSPFTKLRDAFVHGMISEVSPERAKQVFDACRPYLAETVERQLEDAPPINYLRVAAATIYLEFAEGVRLAEARRRFEDEAIGEARGRAMKRGRLTNEQIRKLLAEDDESG